MAALVCVKRDSIRECGVKSARELVKGYGTVQAPTNAHDALNVVAASTHKRRSESVG